MSSLFKEPPEEVRAMTDRTGALQPASGVIYAEADTRNFHEMLFVIHGALRDQAEPSDQLIDLIRRMIEYYTARFRGWYGLEDLAARIEALWADPSEDGNDWPAKIESLMILVGRVNFWIDLQIPWQRFKEAMTEAPEADR